VNSGEVGRRASAYLRPSFFILSVYSGYLVLVRLLTDFFFQTLGLYLTASAWSQRRQGQHEIKVVIGSNAIKAFKTAARAIVNDHVLSIWPLEAANRFHASPTGAHAISRSPVIDMTREKAKRTVIPMMRARSRWADKTMAVPALEHLFRRGSLLAYKTRPGILLLTRTRNSSVCFSQWWISSFASIGCTSFETSKARQHWPRKGKGQDPSWFSNMTVYT